MVHTFKQEKHVQISHNQTNRFEIEIEMMSEALIYMICSIVT